MILKKDIRTEQFFFCFRLENECAKLEQRHMDETAMRQNAAKMVMEKNSQVVSTQK